MYLRDFETFKYHSGVVIKLIRMKMVSIINFYKKNVKEVAYLPTARSYITY